MESKIDSDESIIFEAIEQSDYKTVKNLLRSKVSANVIDRERLLLR